MNCADDRLAKATRALEAPNPTQVELKGAVTDAYYALFYALIDLTIALLAPGPADLEALLARTFEHKTMKVAAARVSDPRWASPALRRTLGLEPTSDQDAYPSQLAEVGKAFKDLQEARHKADYDRQHALSETSAAFWVTSADNALTQLRSIAGDPRLRAFCWMLLLGEKLTSTR
jgi:uncharacterized protein (UPF0332 family)